MKGEGRFFAGVIASLLMLALTGCSAEYFFLRVEFACALNLPTGCLILAELRAGELQQQIARVTSDCEAEQSQAQGHTQGQVPENPDACADLARLQQSLQQVEACIGELTAEAADQPGTQAQICGPAQDFIP
jgi:hypothetical protein